MNTRRATSIHEAAHAIVGDALGWRVVRVSIRPGVSLLIGDGGVVDEHHSHGRVRFEPADWLKPACQQSIVLIAGLVAEMVAGGDRRAFDDCWSGAGETADPARFKRLAAELGISPRALFAESFTAAATILRRRWRDVLILARALSRGETLSGDLARAYAAGRVFTPDRRGRRRRRRKAPSGRSSQSTGGLELSPASALTSTGHRLSEPGREVHECRHANAIGGPSGGT